MQFVGGVFSYEPGRRRRARATGGSTRTSTIPQTRLSAAAGFDRDEVKVTGITYDEMRKGCWDPKARLEDMDVNWTEASDVLPVASPASAARPSWRPRTRSSSDLCVKAYNDWMVEEWCGDSDGRLIPLIIIPLWDAELAAAEIRRNADRGVHAVVLQRDPAVPRPAVDPHRLLGPVLPGVRRDRHGHQHAHRLVVEDAVDLDRRAGRGRLHAHVRQRHVVDDRLAVLRLARALPDLKLAYSEGQIGWIPYILERADKVWEDNRGWGGVADKVPEPPSTYYYRQIYGCFFDDEHGLDSLEKVGVDNITFETDYPHSDSHLAAHPRGGQEADGPPRPDVIHKLVRGNAIRMLDLDETYPERYGNG